MRAAMADHRRVSADREHERNPSDYTTSSPGVARGVEVVGGVRGLGGTGVADLIERTAVSAQPSRTGLADAGYEVLNEVS